MAHHGAHSHCTQRLQQHLALYTSACKHGIDLEAVRIIPRQADKGLALKITRTQPLSGRQWMAGRQHGHFVHGRQVNHARARRCVTAFGQPQIKALGAHPLLQQRAILRGHAHCHLAMRALHARQRTGQQRVAERWHAQHADAGLVRLTQRHGVLDHAVQPIPAALHLIPQTQGARRGFEPPLHPLEQVIAQQLLQPRQFTADGGLRGKQHLRRAGCAARKHQGTEHFDMAMTDALRVGREISHGHGASIARSDGFRGGILHKTLAQAFHIKNAASA